MKKILLTGSEGFIAYYFKKKIDCITYDLINGQDIRDKFKLGLLFENEHFDTVINLAARTGVKLSETYPEEYFSTNVLGLQNLISLCEKYSVRLIHFSTSSVFKPQMRCVSENDVKEPISTYGISKLAGELLLKKSSIDWTIIRPFTVLGGRGRSGMIIDRWLTQYKNGEKFTFYGDGTTCRGYTYAEDLVEGTLMSKAGDYNIGGDQVVSLNDMWGIFKEVFPKAERVILPLPKYDIPQSVADNYKAFKTFGWKPKTDIKSKIREWLLYFSKE
jgi:UDP-glucuronate 4-epimerase